MIGSTVLDIILRYIGSTHVVIIQFHNILSDIILLYCLFHSQHLSTTDSYISIFLLYSKKSDTVIILDEPTKSDCSQGKIIHHMCFSYIIHSWRNQHQNNPPIRSLYQIIQKYIVRGYVYVCNDSFYLNEMATIWISLIENTYSHREKGNIKTNGSET